MQGALLRAKDTLRLGGGHAASSGFLASHGGRTEAARQHGGGGGPDVCFRPNCFAALFTIMIHLVQVRDFL